MTNPKAGKERDLSKPKDWYFTRRMTSNNDLALGLETQDEHAFFNEVVKIIEWFRKNHRGIVYLTKNYKYNDYPKIYGPETFILVGPPSKPQPKLVEAIRKDDV